MYNQIAANKRRTIILISVFVILIMAIGYFFSQYFQAGSGFLVLAVVISIAMSLISYYSGDKIALWTAHAKPITKADNPYVYRLVENLCLTAGLPLPKIYLIADPAINAFATGRDPQHASLALTLGAVEKLQNEELEGVIAHELSHIKNYDIRLMMVVLVLVGIIALLSDWFIRGSLFSRGQRSDENKLNPIIALIGIILIILSPIIAQLIKLAISRRREFLADADGVLLTRYPEGLAGALTKIAQDNLPLQQANNATAHLYLANPFGGTKKLFSRLFATHPPIEERIKALKNMGQAK
ncbi:MAG: M48 family metallopeptidase [Candidatus Buchananbacteria bacterium]